MLLMLGRRQLVVGALSGGQFRFVAFGDDAIDVAAVVVVGGLDVLHEMRLRLRLRLLLLHGQLQIGQVVDDLIRAGFLQGGLMWVDLLLLLLLVMTHQQLLLLVLRAGLERMLLRRMHVRLDGGHIVAARNDALRWVHTVGGPA